MGQLKTILFFFFLPLSLLAQNKKVSKPGWRMITAAGLVTGESDTKPVFQLSGGLVRDRYFAGIGIGYESYRFNSFPLFADCRMSFGKKRIGFLYANGGYNFPGHTKEETEFSKTSDRLKGGFYMDAGIGYRVRLGTFNKLSFSAGYSRKDIRHIKTFVYPCFTGDCPDNIDEFKYSLGRMVAKMSWELGY
ncbi:MAG TPA: hypothetical protein VJU78_06740 [Chitinophagaceae bacterium]|nr:hypothetical protein [Chitinophagaceae bacterium]